MDSCAIVAAARRFDPGDATGRVVFGGTFNAFPTQLSVSPDARRFAFATRDVIGVAPLP